MIDEKQELAGDFFQNVEYRKENKAKANVSQVKSILDWKSNSGKAGNLQMTLSPRLFIEQQKQQDDQPLFIQKTNSYQNLVSKGFGNFMNDSSIL